MSSRNLANGTLKFLTYNIDGLNPGAIIYRTNTILSLILSESPDVVQLQEVVATTASTIVKTMVKNGYTSFHESDQPASMCHYFTLSFARTDKIKNATIRRIPFSGAASSEQGRDSLQLTLTCMNKQWMFINCHLESCGAAFKSTGSAIRMAQLRDGLEAISHHSNVGPAVLAGDLNIRDPEAAKVMSDYTRTILDAAEVVEKGRKTNTWYMPGPSTYSARYDRVYSNQYAGLRPVAYKVIGGEDIIEGTGLDALYELSYSTPSDHRGVVVTYAIEVSEDERSASETQSSSVETIVNTNNSNTTSNPRNTNLNASTAKRSRIPSDAEVITLDDSDSEINVSTAANHANKRMKSEHSSDNSSGGGDNGGDNNNTKVLTAKERRDLFLKALEKRTNTQV